MYDVVGTQSDANIGCLYIHVYDTYKLALCLCTIIYSYIYLSDSTFVCHKHYACKQHVWAEVQVA